MINTNIKDDLPDKITQKMSNFVVKSLSKSGNKTRKFTLESVRSAQKESKKISRPPTVLD